MREIRVQSLDQEDPLEKEIAIYSSILAWRILWTEKPSRLQSMGSQRVGHDWATEQWQNASWVTFNIFFILYYLVKTTKLSGGGGLVAKSCPTLATPWTVVYQAPLSMEFSRQEYWSRLLFPSPGDLPNPGIKPGSPALEADALTSEPPGKPRLL